MYCEFCDLLVLDRNVKKDEVARSYWCNQKDGYIDLDELDKIDEKTLKGELP